MKTLPIRFKHGGKLEIRAIASEAEAGARDPCKTLKFFEEQRNVWPEELDKLCAILSDASEFGPTYDPSKFKKLPGTELYEFKSPQGLRLICFWGGGGLIICTHGYVKDGQKAPKSEIALGKRMMRDYLAAEKQNQLNHVNPTRIIAKPTRT